jgi:hypothetical protein
MNLKSRKPAKGKGVKGDVFTLVKKLRKRSWMGLDAVDADVLVSEDADAFKKVSDETG